ncbi:MAG: hypothetical protein KIH64_015000 [Mycobacterium sp.]|nr:hypothetical protein [Mycobacterium sp.]
MDDEQRPAAISVAAWRRLNEAALQGAREQIRLLYQIDLLAAVAVELVAQLGSQDRAAAHAALGRVRAGLAARMQRRQGPSETPGQEDALALLNDLIGAAGPAATDG